MSEKRPYTAKKMASNHKYDEKTYDRVTYRPKKEIGEILRTITGESVNGYINKAVLNQLRADGFLPPEE